MLDVLCRLMVLVIFATKMPTFLSPADGLSISYVVTVPEGAAKGILQMAHGMAENNQRYLQMMDYFSSKGYVCVMNDHRGHGESVISEDDLGYMYDGGYKAMVEDLHELTKIIKGQYPGLPIFLYGHSMGSMVVRLYTKHYDDELSGLIVSGSPSSNPAAGMGALLAKTIGKIKGDHHRSRLLQKMSLGAYNKKITAPTSPNSWICTAQSVVSAYDDSPHCGFTFTTNGFKNLFLLMKETYSPKGWKMANPELPILFLSGENDPCIVSKKAFIESVHLMKKVGYKNTSFKLYPSMRHEIHNEPGKEEVYEDIWNTLAHPA